MKLYFPVAICTVALGCSELHDFYNHDHTPYKDNHIITQEKAIASLMSFLDALDSTKTKSGRNRSVSDVICFNIGDPITKGVHGYNPHLYFVNFSDNNGYAILAADDRIQEDIIAIVDKGNVSYADVLRASNCLLNGQRSQIDTSFNNFNEFEPYYELGDDWYVGDLETVEDSTFMSSICDLPLQLCINYAANSIRSHIDPGFNPEDPPTYTDTYIDTVYNFAYTPLMDTCGLKYWSQSRSPFNDNCPVVKEYVFYGSQERASAGCVPLSIARIMAFNKYPSTLIYNNTLYDWNTIRNLSDSTIIASYLRMIGDYCGTIYFYQGSFTLPSLAASFLSNYCCYTNVDYSDYSNSTVMSMLENRRPVFICSLPRTSYLGFDFEKSHAWLLDGYAERVITTIRYTYQGSTLIDQSESRRTTTMIHCDWGWRTDSNGLFLSGVFDLRGQDVHYDPGVSDSATTNYNFYIKTITYSML